MNVKDVVSSENGLLKEGELASRDEVREALFNTDNVVTDRTDHGLSELTKFKEMAKEEAEKEKDE